MVDFYGELLRVWNDKTLGPAIKASILFTNLAAVIVLLGIVILIILSIFVRDTEFITKNPLYFTVEMILMALAAFIPFIFLYWSRTGTIPVSGIYATLLLTLKFGGMHLLMSTSGAYTYLFKA